MLEILMIKLDQLLDKLQKNNYESNVHHTDYTTYAKILMIKLELLLDKLQ